MFRISYLCVICGLCQASLSLLQAAADNKLGESVDRLLAAYEESLLPMRSRVAFLAESETVRSGAYNWGVMNKRSTVSARVFRDHKRLDTTAHVQMFKSDGSDKPSRAMKFKAVSTDLTLFYQTPIDRPPRYLAATTNTDEQAPKIAAILEDGICLDGYVGGNKSFLLPDVMRAGSALRVREDMELVDGHETYVLEADTKYGKHIVWLDPEYGFNPRRIVIQKSGDDLFDDKPLSTPLPDRRAGEANIATHSVDSPRLSVDTTLDSVKIERIGDVFVLTEARITTVESFPNNTSAKRVCVFRRSEIDLEPDFDAMGAFVMDAPNGTPVRFLDRPSPTGGVDVRWRDGKIDAYVDDEVVRDLVQTAEKLKGDDSYANRTGADASMVTNEDRAGIKGPNGAAEEARFDRSFLFLLGLAGVAVVGLAAGWFVLRRSSSSSRES